MFLMTPEELAGYAAAIPVSPISDEFTYERFTELLADDATRGKRSVKAFMASRPRISGVGNGYVQDICFRAGLHPGGTSPRSRRASAGAGTRRSAAR